MLIALAVAAGTALVCGLFVATTAVTAQAVRDAVPGADEPGGSVVVRATAAQDAEAQDAAASAVIHGLFGDTIRVEEVSASRAEGRAWRLSPEPASLDLRSASVIASGLPKLRDQLSDGDAVGRVVVEGDLPAVMDEVAAGARAASALAPVPIGIAAVIAWITVLQLGRLLGASRGAETALLRARGLSRVQGAVIGGVEAALIASVGVGVGFVATGLIGRATIASLPGTAGGWSAWPVALLALAVVTLTLVVGAAAGARAAGGAASMAGRVVRASSPAAAVLLVIVAGVVVWLVATGPATPDPSAVALGTLAPILGLLAGAVLGVLALAPLAALIARLTALTPTVAPVYPARQVARRLVASATAVALIVIAISGAVVAGAYAATWGSAADAARSLDAGAPLRAQLREVAPADLVPVADVEAEAPAVIDEVAAGKVDATLLALPAGRIADVVLPVDGLVGPERLGEELARVSDDSPGVALPDGADGIAVRGEVRSLDLTAAAATGLRVWMTDASGAPVAVPLSVTAVDADGRTLTRQDSSVITGTEATADLTGRAALPSGTAPWRVLAVEVARGQGWTFSETAFSGLAVAATSGGEDSEDETALDLGAVSDLTLQGVSAGGVDSGLAWSVAGERADPIPALITERLAADLDLTPGDDAEFAAVGSGRRYAVTVTQVVPALPSVGSAAGALVDIDTLSARSLTTQVVPGRAAATAPLATEVWAAGSADALAAKLGVAVQTPSTTASGIAGSIAPVWVAAAIGVAVLSGIALGAVFVALVAPRGGEVRVLRALGITPAAQARMRAGEGAEIAILSAVFGVAAGLALSALLVPALVARAIPGGVIDPRLRLDLLPTAIALGVVALAVVVSLVATARAVRAQGAHAPHGSAFAEEGAS